MLKNFERALESSVTTQVLDRVQPVRRTMRDRRQSVGDVVKKRFFEYQTTGWQKCERALTRRKALQIQDLDEDQQIELLEEVSLKVFSVGGKSVIDKMEAYETIIDGEHTFMVRVFANGEKKLFRYHPTSRNILGNQQNKSGSNNKKNIPDRFQEAAKQARSIMYHYLNDAGLFCDCE